MEPVFLLFFRYVIDSKIWVGFRIKAAVMYPVTDLVFFHIFHFSSATKNFCQRARMFTKEKTGSSLAPIVTEWAFCFRIWNERVLLWKFLCKRY